MIRLARACYPLRAALLQGGALLCRGLLPCVAGALPGCGSGAAAPPSTEAPPAPYARPEYSALSETGLYSALAGGPLDPAVRAFAPRFALWSDGASKQRWLALPPATQVDTNDMDRWRFPVGTRAWKTFARDGVLLETRLIERYGLEPDEYWMGSFIWNEQQSDATFAEAGQENVQGTTHDAPAQDRCPACHNGEPGRLLGFSALQLSSDSEDHAWSLTRLAEEQRLSASPEPDANYAPPGDVDTAAALGYLHANCGHCHNPRGTSWPDTQMLLRLDVQSGSVEETPLFQSVVKQPLQYYRAEPGTLRVSPGAPELSAVLARMSVRGPMEQMPPLATEAVDAEGLELIRRWIAGLAP